MIAYLQMSRKKTREEKIKSAQKISSPRVTYSYKAETPSVKVVAVSPEKLDYHRKEIRLIIIASIIIFSFNIGLYILLITGTVRLGFLGY